MKMGSGEERAWQSLNDLNPADVCKKAGVIYNPADICYVMRSLGMDFMISPRKKEIKGMSPEGDLLIKKYGYFFNLAALCYLVSAKNIPLSDKLVQPVQIRGGALFFRGTHVLPLDKMAEKYAKSRSEFISRAESLGGKIMNYGDASVELLPMPRIPTTIILWLSDDEFPARADLLFDATSEQQLPLDILWSIAMLSILVML